MPSHSREPNARRKRLYALRGRRPKSKTCLWRLETVFGSALRFFAKFTKTTSCRNILNELWQLSPLVLFVLVKLYTIPLDKSTPIASPASILIYLFADFHYWQTDVDSITEEDTSKGVRNDNRHAFCFDNAWCVFTGGTTTKVFTCYHDFASFHIGCESSINIFHRMFSQFVPISNRQVTSWK